MAARKRGRNDQAPGWAWMLFGLSIGLAVALVVYLKSGPDRPNPAVPVQAATGTIGRSRAAVQTAPRSTPSADAPDEPSGEPAAEDGGVKAEDEAETEFEFFRLLPESEVVLPENEAAAGGGSATPREYTIQAGSFRTQEDADRLQARLALLNMEATIQPAIVGNQIYYRVVIGPLSERAEINRVLRRLRDERIESLPPRRVSD
jgi:cell division protein FtsN